MDFDCEYLCCGTVADNVKIPQQVFEVIEELRSRRTKDVENEAKINNLIKDRVELISKVDDLNMKIKLIEAENQIKLDELHTANITQTTLKEEFIRRQKLIVETNEKEIKLLRDEICKFQLTNFALERKSNDQEKKLGQLSSILENFMNKKSKFESCFKACREESKDIEVEVDKLKAEVEECKHINKNYNELNKHIGSEVQNLKSELKSLECQLTFANAKNARFILIEEMLENRFTPSQSIQEEISLLREANKLLCDKVEGLEKELNNMLEMFTKSQKLVETQDVNNSKFLVRLTGLEDKLLSYEEKCSLLDSDLDNCKSIAEVAENAHRNEMEMLLCEKNAVEVKLAKLQDECDEMKRSKTDLEELNSKWASKNFELMQLISSRDSKLVESDGIFHGEGFPMDGLRNINDEIDLMEKDTDNALLDFAVNESNCSNVDLASESISNSLQKDSSPKQNDQGILKEGIVDVTMVYKRIIKASLRGNLRCPSTNCNESPKTRAVSEDNLKRAMPTSAPGDEIQKMRCLGPNIPLI